MSLLFTISMKPALPFYFRLSYSQNLVGFQIACSEQLIICLLVFC